MESKIPLPTDNIFKFMALFGLLLMITSLSLLIYSRISTNETIWSSANAIYDLELSKDPNKEKKSEILERRVSIAIENMTFFKWSLSILFVFGGLLSSEGFRRWYKVLQPVHDEILNLQKQKLELEIKILNKQRQHRPSGRTR